MLEGEDDSSGQIEGTVGVALKRSEVPRSTPVKFIVRQDSDLVRVSLRDAQPMKADEHICDVIGASQVVAEPCSCIEHRLESAC